MIKIYGTNKKDTFIPTLWLLVNHGFNIGFIRNKHDIGRNFGGKQ
ncbi:hypothetical protein HMPREF0653_02469 [Prevotella disiens JCM 6334 = ATCC 29426]|uniref:Uncharacterized protein n=1 Tax=Prevotella disiens JCM 6334 = ATCC 29426 TaxID=1235811 RepID=A0ABN0NP32_9BACT|nr:hypothetical protein HMPREF0653_02469 [Prevotella disiens JCM 6334 = ATCC 29426]